MLTVAIGGFVFLTVFLGVFVLGRSVAGRPPRDHRQAARRFREMRREPEPDTSDEGVKAGGVWQAVMRLGAWVLPPDGKQVSDLGARLSLAGYRHPSAVVYFTGLQLVLVLAFAAAGGTAAVVGGAPWSRVLMWAAAGGAVGLIAPSFALTSQMKKRARQLRTALPDALDILVLSVEGGASLNAALALVTDEIQPVHPLLGAELVVVEREVQLGMTPGEAFRSFADRCGIAEARDLAAALVQSERYGASVAKVLRSYADSARADRQVWAEEVAQKAGVKILFPMLLCIFPAMFIVLLGPAAFQMSRLFAR
ncbi:type II secretion system F family protein [Fimbriiglobus ruber]|uniref:Type II/IV secretion system protein TadC, associated with Flp pilus assembly n=1 Tax=Fimbriiglobus ruber TaxID=1908690 RepID=A0A225DSW7_9BACT|nr:type II secretion system F family protein [Fimbriiglobus ruber]OWK44532.1 Type II/IV secretion system protein TadC, associated with Flp pilus assembly [Fimbriiglobus ruber]